jgi:hypothetical protein
VPRRLAFGRQLDVRVGGTHRPDDHQALTALHVAGYLAKYATKTATDDTVGTTAHHRRLQAVVADLDLRARIASFTTSPESSAYELLGRWGRMLGFRGHFATKSRRYSVTLGQLRRARQRAQARIAASRANGTPLDLASLEADLLADQEETTLVIGRWSYLGSGSANDGETALATAAAARAREYSRQKATHRQQVISE